MPFATTAEGTQIYYETVGTGEPLVLISGQGEDHTSWDGLRNDFSDHYHVIVIDNRGTGQSDKPTDKPYTTRGFAQDVITVLDDLGIERAHAYGHSMGGRIAQWLAIDHGDRIGALVLGATTPGNAHGVPRSAETIQLWAHPPTDPKEAMAAFALLIFSPGFIAQHPEAVQKFFQQPALSDELRALHFRASEGHDTWDLLPTITAPTLVIHGSEDPINVTANAPLLAEHIPNAEVYLIEGGRHAYTIEFREESSRVIKEFLARHPL